MCKNDDGPHKNRAIESRIDSDQSGLKDEQFGSDSSFGSVTTAVLDTVDHLASEARGDQGASIGAVIETVLKHTDYELGSVLNEAARLQANGEIYAADGDGCRVKPITPMTDGGQDLIDCCPECEAAQFFPVHGSHVGGAATHDDEYRCQRCKHTFDEPDQRESKQDNPTRRGVAGKLAEIGESKGPMADGGLNDETAADHIESVMTAADAALTDGELQMLGAVVEYLRDDNSRATATDGGRVATTPDDAELTRFQQDILRVLAKNGELHGLGIKETLENQQYDEVLHGRLYPNLDDLKDYGYIEKHALDNRTNGYSLTDEGKTLARRIAEKWLQATDALNGGEL